MSSVREGGGWKLFCSSLQWRKHEPTEHTAGERAQDFLSVEPHHLPYEQQWLKRKSKVNVLESCLRKV